MEAVLEARKAIHTAKPADKSSTAIELVCFDCGASFTDQTNCLQCNDSPLLDPKYPAVSEELAKSDDQRRNKALHRSMFVGFVLAAIIAYPLLPLFFTEHIGTETRYWGTGPITETTYESVDVFGYLILIGGAGAGIGHFFARHRFRPRFARFLRYK